MHSRTASLRAVVFDVDGTLAETERHGHRLAFNAAFESRGLPDRWDEDVYGDLLAVAGGKERLRHYLTAYQGWSDADAEREAAELHQIKSTVVADLLAQDRIPARPGVVRLLDDLAAAGVTLAVATTGSREWVERLLDRILARAERAEFAVVVTGEDVRTLKPDPEAFVLAARLLGADAAGVVVVEDSPNGVAAAKGAHMCCLAVPGEYMRAEALRDADLIVDSFGEPDSPARTLHNPLGVETVGIVDASLCRRLLAAASRARKR